MNPLSPPVKRQHLRDIRTTNRTRILRALQRPELVSRQELAEQLDLTPASLSRIAKELIEDGICIEAPLVRDASQRGRPSVALCINPNGGYLIAISISSFSRLITVIDLAGKVRHQKVIPIHVTESGVHTVDFIGRYVDELVYSNVLDRRLILGATLTIPGSINVETGFLTKSVLVNWPDFAIQNRLSERLKCHVRVENNGDALCRHFMDTTLNHGAVHSSVFLAHVSERMGASIAIGGRIVRRLADEGWINGIKVSTETGDIRGEQPLRDLASGRAILDNISGYVDIDENGSGFSERLAVAVTAANQGVEAVEAAFYRAGYQLGSSLLPLTIAIAPEVIVFAGPVPQAKAFSKGAKAGYQKATDELDIQPSKIIVSAARYSEASENLARHDFFLSGGYNA